MSDEFTRLSEIFHDSLLIFTDTGVLLRLYCPIFARVIRPFGHFTLGEWVCIHAIHEDKQGRLLYKIKEELHPYHHFEIQHTNIISL